MPRARASGTSDREHALTGEKLALLAVFAHPEEEMLGPAGTLARYASEGIRVAMVTAARETAHSIMLLSPERPQVLRETSCSCLTCGTQRICLIDRAGRLEIGDEPVMEERLVRLVRELRPQVIVTHGPQGASGDPDEILVSRLTTRAFHLAADPKSYPQHSRDGLGPFQPKKLYYSVLPQSLLTRWGIEGLSAVPDSEVSTVLDVSSFAEAKLRTLYCQRAHMSDHAPWLASEVTAQWDREYFTLAVSELHRAGRREHDLFAGLR